MFGTDYVNIPSLSNSWLLPLSNEHFGKSEHSHPFGGRGKDWLCNLKEDGAQHRTGAHAIGVKHLKVMTRSASRFLTRTKSLSRSHIRLTCKNMAWLLLRFRRRKRGNNIRRLHMYSRQYADVCWRMLTWCVFKTVCASRCSCRGGWNTCWWGCRDHIQEVVVLDILDPVCVDAFISVEINTWTIVILQSHSIGVDKCLLMMQCSNRKIGYPWNTRIVSFGGVSN